MDDVYVYFIQFESHKVHEFVVPCPDGYTVYIDEDLDQASREAAYAHAMEHIRAQDWEMDSVQEIEARAHHLLPSPAPIRKASELIPVPQPDPIHKEDPKERQSIDEEQLKRRAKFERAWNRLLKRRERLEARGILWEDYVFAKRERELWDV